MHLFLLLIALDKDNMRNHQFFVFVQYYHFYCVLFVKDSLALFNEISKYRTN